MKIIIYRAVSAHMLEKIPAIDMQVVSEYDILIDKTSYRVGLKILLEK